MRYSTLPIVLFSVLLLSAPAVTHAQRRQGRRTKSPTWQPTASRQPEGHTASGAREVGGDEQQVMARVRGYQMQLEREEKVLNQRLAYAAQLRQQGLAKKDQNLLNQAEQYERKALSAYQGRVQQYEKANLNPRSGGRASNYEINAKAAKSLPSAGKSKNRRRSSRSRSSKSAKSVWGWLK